MDNKPNFAERIATLKATAFALREAAETVLAEVHHMEAAAQRFQERGEKRGRRNMPAPTR
jgi:anti-sigma factor RsiW